MPTDPPEHLSLDSQALWVALAEDWVLDLQARCLLETALSARDRIAQARELLEKEGLIVKGRAHPGLKIEKDSQVIFLRAWRQLQFDVAPPMPRGRPPGDSARPLRGVEYA